MIISRNVVSVSLQYAFATIFVIPVVTVAIIGAVSEKVSKASEYILEVAINYSDSFKNALAKWASNSPEGTMERLKKVEYDGEAEKYTRPR